MPVTPLMSFVKLEAGTVPTSSVAPTPQRSTLFATWYALHESIIGQTWSLELVSTLTKADLTTLAITDSRRATAKTATVKGNVLSVQFADIDLSALAALYPSKTYTVADFAGIFGPHVGKPVADGIGQLVQIPGVWIKQTGGQWRYSFCEKRTGKTYTVNAIYRSESEQQLGRVVPSSEYTVSSSTGASSGVVVLDVIFTQEQLTKGGQPYYFKADIQVTNGSGTTDERLASYEIQRLLGIAGITVNAASFTTAHTYCDQEKMRVDAGYPAQRTLKAIIEDLLFVARGVIRKNSSGEWVIVQDKPTAISANYLETSDQISIDGLEMRDKPSLVQFFYKPLKSGTEEWNATPRTRTTGGTLPVKRYQNPYVRDDELADRLCDYLSKRDSIKRKGTITIHAVQFDVRDVITIDAVTAWSGRRSWMIESVRRPADKNILQVREYDATIYTYSSTSLPSAASNSYTPDYSQTPPLAPTSLTYDSGSSGTAVATDGTVRAYMRWTCVPPTAASSFARILFTAIDTTGAVTILEGKLNGSVYEVIFDGLRTGVVYTVKAQAYSVGGVEGAIVSTTQTAPGYVQTIPTPTVPLWTNIPGKAIRVYWGSGGAIPDPAYYRLEARTETSAGSGTYSSWTVLTEGLFLDTVDNTIEYNRLQNWRVRLHDRSGNYSAWSTTGAAIIGPNLTDTEVTAASLTNASMAAATLKRSILKTATGSVATGTLAAGNGIDLELEEYCFSPSFIATLGSGLVMMAMTGGTSGATTRARFRVYNNSGANAAATADYRYVDA